MLAKVRRALAITIVALLVIVIAALGYRAYRQHKTADMLAINSERSLVEAKFVTVGGIEQWVQIRGEDTNNPVILVVHGGPGMSNIPVTNRSMRPWESNFTVVNWDQRGAGRTYMQGGRSAAPSPTTEQIIQDGIDVAEYVRSRLNKQKIILLGASWGSIVGIEMARRRPDLFYAYVGTGQIVNMQRNEVVGYKRLMERVRAADDKSAIEQLEKIGPPPYAELSLMGAERQVLMAHPPASERNVMSSAIRELLTAPGYSLRDAYDVIAAGMDTNHLDRLYVEFMAYDVTSKGTTFELPMFFLQGADDIQTPTELVVELFPTIVAPKKELVLIPEGGHLAIGALSETFHQELSTRVRPLAIAEASRAGARNRDILN